MSFCPNCGAQVQDGLDYCPQCGTPMHANQSPQYNVPPQQPGYQAPPQYNVPPVIEGEFVVQQETIPERYRPISMWGYFGYQLLFSIPIIGFIILLVYAFGGNGNINVRNFARSYFCWLIIAVVIAVIVLIIMLIAPASSRGFLIN